MLKKLCRRGFWCTWLRIRWKVSANINGRQLLHFPFMKIYVRARNFICSSASLQDFKHFHRHLERKKEHVEQYGNLETFWSLNNGRSAIISLNKNATIVRRNKGPDILSSVNHCAVAQWIFWAGFKDPFGNLEDKKV